MNELVELYAKLPLFALVLARLAGMFALQPLLASLAVPGQVRALLILALAALVTPLVPPPAQLPDTLAQLTLALAAETALGLFLGLLVATCFVGVQLGGLLIAQESGLAIGQILDPSLDEELSLLSAFYAQLCVVIYLIAGGHRLVLSACIDSFQTIPLLGVPDFGDVGYELLVDALTTAGSVAVRVGAPAVVTLFLVNIALGFIARTVPQLNVITLGFSMKALIAFVVMAVALPSAIEAFLDTLALTFDWLDELVMA